MGGKERTTKLRRFFSISVFVLRTENSELLGMTLILLSSSFHLKKKKLENPEVYISKQAIKSAYA